MFKNELKIRKAEKENKWKKQQGKIVKNSKTKINTFKSE